MVSVIIPTYNEEKALPATLEALSRQKGTYEVIVVDGGSSDRTRAIVEAEPRLRFENASKGRAVQMNAAARLARGEWLLFLHADTVLPEGAIYRLNKVNMGIDILIDMAARELGISTVALSKRLCISQPTASQSIKRGEKIVKEKELKLMG